VVLSSPTTLVVVAVATLGRLQPGALPLSRARKLAFLVLFTYLLPSVVLILPLYLMLVSLGLSNTLAAW
jgi:multiple sugar transport system permease protein